jgi:hypothetical protein
LIPPFPGSNPGAPASQSCLSGPFPVRWATVRRFRYFAKPVAVFAAKKRRSSVARPQTSAVSLRYRMFNIRISRAETRLESAETGSTFRMCRWARPYVCRHVRNCRKEIACALPSRRFQLWIATTMIMYTIMNLLSEYLTARSVGVAVITTGLRGFRNLDLRLAIPSLARSSRRCQIDARPTMHRSKIS